MRASWWVIPLLLIGVLPATPQTRSLPVEVNTYIRFKRSVKKLIVPLVWVSADFAVGLWAGGQR
jgi:hypothetical protein